MSEDLSEAKPLTKRQLSIAADKEKGHYVNNVALSIRLEQYAAECIDAAEAGLDKPIVPHDIAEAVMKIVEKMSHRPNFSGYRVGGWLSEMKLDAIENVLKYIHKYDKEKAPQKYSGYAYISITVWRAFLRRIEKEKKHTRIKTKMYDTLTDNTMFMHLDPHDADDMRFHTEHDAMDRHEE